MPSGQEALGSRTKVGRGEKGVGDGGRQEEECVCEAEGNGEALGRLVQAAPRFSFVNSFALQQCGPFWRTTPLQQVSFKKAQWLV